MKNAIYSLIALLICNHSVLAQEFSREFGIITRDEINMKSYDKDPDADALVIYDIGVSEFIDTDRGFNIKFSRTKKIKILSNRAMDEAEIKVPYYVDGYGKTEDIKKIEAYSYNFEQGRTIKKQLEQSTIYDEIINLDFGRLFIFWHTGLHLKVVLLYFSGFWFDVVESRSLRNCHSPEPWPRAQFSGGLPDLRR